MRLPPEIQAMSIGMFELMIGQRLHKKKIRFIYILATYGCQDMKLKRRTSPWNLARKCQVITLKTDFMRILSLLHVKI